MDYRLYILAGSFLFLVVSLIILLAVLGRARKASEPPPEPGEAGPWPMLYPAPQEADARLRETFAKPPTGVTAVLNEPIRTGSWQPESSSRGSSKAQPTADYWDSLVEQPEQLVRETSPGQESAATPAPAAPAEKPTPTPPPTEKPVTAEVAQEVPPESKPAEPAPQQPAPASAEPVATPAVGGESVARVVDRAQQDAEIDHLIEELVEDPDSVAVEPAEPPTAPAAAASVEEPSPPSPPSAPTPPSAPSPHESVSVPAEPPAPSAPAPPTSQPSPTPGPSAAPAPPSPKDPEPEVLATEQPAAPADAAQPPAPPEPPAHKGIPAAQTARVTAVSAKRKAGPPRQDVPSARRTTTPAERPRATVGGTGQDVVPRHELVAPVEMWFGDDRVGVKPGSRTYDLFQKYARVLFDDLQRSKSSTLV